jgi:hypothetical protein
MNNTIVLSFECFQLTRHISQIKFYLKKGIINGRYNKQENKLFMLIKLLNLLKQQIYAIYQYKIKQQL